MKTILITIALLIGLNTQAQEMFVKNIYFKNSPEDSLLMYSFEYEDNWDLKHVFFHAYDEVSQIWEYENDTLVRHIDIHDTTRYTYYTDSIFEDNGIWENKWYYTNSEGQVYTWGAKYYYYVWEDDNLVGWYDKYDKLGKEYIYTDYVNPFYDMLSSFRSSYVASYNQTDELISHVGGLTTDWTVVSALNNYPTEIITWNNGEYSYTQYFEYYNPTDVPELPSHPATILSIKYFDIMGRKIEKPKNGFYIERKTTDKGIISTKYFVQ